MPVSIAAFIVGALFLAGGTYIELRMFAGHVDIQAIEIIFPALVGGILGLSIALYLSRIHRRYLQEITAEKELLDELYTQIAQRNQAVLNSRNKYRSLFDNANEGIIIRDSLTNEIIEVNALFAARLGYQIDELVGDTIEKFSPLPGDRERRERVRNLGQIGSDVVERIHRRKDGSEFPVEVSSSSRRLDGRDIVISYVRDITERKALEKAKDEFVALVSHELRTPLTSIKGSLGIVLGGAAGPIASDAQDLLQIAHKNSERLALLINDLLDLTKLDAGKIGLRFRPLDLVDLVNSAIEAYEGYAAEFGVTFASVITPNTSVIVDADENRLMQVLANLLSNAAKFSPDGGEVSISIENRQSFIRISVKDQGVGIPDEFKDYIFDRFAQVDSSSSRPVGGTGLGLAISRAIIEEHGGKIGFESEPAVGSTFYFDLPVAEEARIAG